MPKTARNEPCPCGSGKKYKHCCLPKDEQAERVAFAERKKVALEEQREREHARAAERARIETQLEDDDELTEASNAVLDLLHAGRLEEAERAARELLVRYPYVHDGYDRLGTVYQARGQNREAADCYRKVIDFVIAHPDQYEPDFAESFRALVAKLDPPQAG
ncbi:MAG: SEC-C metal-binding domain-containing protein [Steroidobacteraceae bacterium]